jgi:2-polyprenyl-6-methoxyphenol hydroxylase-like FAD-dependent oxidoreductase
LLARGSQELERFFPGFERTMRERGALELDFGTEFATLRPDGWQPRLRGGIPTLFASRGLLESIVRELLVRHSNVELRERTTATGLLTDRGTSPSAGGRPARLEGVKVCAIDGGPVDELAADLVVDASGRGSKVPEWLCELGFPAPAETVVDSGAGYSTRWFAAAPPERWPSEWWWKAAWVDLDATRPEQALAGVLFPVEGRRWIVTIVGVAGNHPPADEAGFTAALERLASPIIAEAVRLGEPISKVYSYRAMANRFRHYERWPAELAGFVAVGDAASTFNPVYGQGMTSGAISATILADCLARHDVSSAAFPRRFFRAQAGFLRDAWALATGADFRLATTAGKRPLGFGLTTRFMDALFSTASHDVEVRHRVSEVINMLVPPARLFDPWVVGRVARASLGRLFAAPGGGAAAPIPPMPPASLEDFESAADVEARAA